MDDRLTSREVELLQGLERELPPRLEDRVAEALRNEGLLAGRRTPRSWKRLRTAAAALLLFAAGAASHALWAPAPEGLTEGRQGTGTAGVTETARYVLLLQMPRGQALPAGERAARVAEYRGWAREMAADGRLEIGERLADAAVSLGPPPAGDRAERLSGLFIIRAADDEEAERLARTCPHLRHGGRIELRRIDSG